MVRRAVIAAVGGVGLIAPVKAGCGALPAFTCTTDDQCSTEGEGGLCELSSYCSFPDPDCPSRRRYGDYAGGALAGLCVGEAPAGEDGETAVATSDASSGGGSGGGSGDRSAGDSGDGSSGNASASTGPVDESETGAPPACTSETSEPNDDEASAEAIEDGCAFERAGAIGGGDEADWYVLLLEPACLTADNEIAIETAANVELCAHVTCMRSGTNASCSGATSGGGGMAQCCGEPELSATLLCTGGEDPIYHLSITSNDPVCADYELSFGPTM